MTYENRKTLTTTLAAAAVLVVLALACKRDGEEGEEVASEPETTTATGEQQDEFEEADEDLVTVDYSEFYDALAPHGTWIEVDPGEIGLELKGKASVDTTPILERLLGVRKAFADISASARVDAMFVWQPGPGLAAGAGAGAEAGAAVPATAGAEAGVAVEAPAPSVEVAAEAPAAEAGVAVEVEEYTPYENGQWVNTDAGWYFHASTPAEEITSHYGRWTFSASLGWVWVPGSVWAPAWVDWREDETYVAWTPIAPGIHIRASVLVSPPVWSIDRYVIVEKRFFLEPGVYRYKYSVKRNPNKIMIKSMARIDGVMVKNKTVVNVGPGVGRIEKECGRKATMVKIHKVGSKGKVKYSQKSFSVYTPKFKKVKVQGKASASKPKASVKYKDAKASYKARLKVKDGGHAGIKHKEQAKAGSGGKGSASVKVSATAGGKGPKGKIGGGGKVSSGFGLTGGKPGGGSKGGKPGAGGKGGKPGGGKGGKPGGGAKGGKPGGGKGKK